MSAPDAPLPGLALRPGEPLARHSPWRTGGRCREWAVAHRLDALMHLVERWASQGVRSRVAGAGTRTVFRDGELDSAFVRLGVGFNHVVHRGDAVWEVGAAAPVPALVAAAASAGHGGVEQQACVPGSVGAALLLDEGWEPWVQEVTWLHRGSVRTGSLADVRGQRQDQVRASRTARDQVRASRSARDQVRASRSARDQVRASRTARIVLGAVLRLDADAREVAERTADTWRRGHPLHPSAWYEAPRSRSVRSILQRSNLTRVRLRQIAVPALAPELLVNLGGGTAADMALLQRSTMDRVRRLQGVELKLRLRWVGRKAPVDGAVEA